MRRFLFVLLAAIGFVACSHPASSKEPFKEIRVADLVSLQAAPGSRVAVFDANQPDFRKQNGVIPGAKLLSHFKNYDVAKELPSDKTTPLVFYCADLR